MIAHRVVSLQTYMCYELLASMRRLDHRFEFSFSLKPIIQVMARLPATFHIDFVCSNSDFLEARRIRCRGPDRVPLWGKGRLGFYVLMFLGFR